jgi:hypothetical protein
MAAAAPRNRLPGADAPKAPCKTWRDLGATVFADVDMYRGLLATELAADEIVVTTLPEVAAAFGMAPQSVKGDWRDSGMPGRPGHWDLAEILAWAVQRDARARGLRLPHLVDAVHQELGKLIERYTLPAVLQGAARYQREWDAVLAECEAEEKASKRRKPPTRKEAK